MLIQVLSFNVADAAPASTRNPNTTSRCSQTTPVCIRDSSACQSSWPVPTEQQPPQRGTIAGTVADVSVHAPPAWASRSSRPPALRSAGRGATKQLPRAPKSRKVQRENARARARMHANQSCMCSNPARTSVGLFFQGAPKATNCWLSHK